MSVLFTLLYQALSEGAKVGRGMPPDGLKKKRRGSDI